MSTRIDPRTYYKVITVKGRKSAIIRIKGSAITYPVGKWVKSRIPNSYLFIFDEPYHAQSWIQCLISHGTVTYGQLQVVPCKVKNIKPIKAILNSVTTCKYSFTQLNLLWIMLSRHPRLDSISEIIRTERNTPLGKRLWSLFKDHRITSPNIVGAAGCKEVKCLE